MALDWNVRRILTKANYRIHTDAIKSHLIPAALPKQWESRVYAEEADVLNVSLFGKTASEWRKEHPDAKGNVRDQATIEQLLVLTNMETLNAHFIEQGTPQNERLSMLHRMAVTQLQQLSGTKSVRDLKNMHNNLQRSEPPEK